ncbi:hypothetical protein A2867_03185 [Candidatus Daviesbacteria bacterium RIFCSPHIGHO2_01_FULL_40_11]|uniref:Regulatory protein RecX n=1 Tax=Candidatus Daviesbacteria bacterium RIFCSPHIGHO2_01_FULL_40_11 TaxID=1797762 RepID=A0A1F5JL49_9BACT|nr:MAG: hypothetical protein A2867_03185 [Candidatus Daviesbacteria bacterium RIFCSPHIGHO2_01_FULL_40_11]OGE63026.1 MAG: hypothetical protein A2964_02305 [Candidatus Daviesbacteria bacterium RIFCSPLOWO2_01_FULL_40_27]
MPKITSVEPQKKTLRLSAGQGPKRFNVFLDGEFAFGADEDLVVEYRLVPGKVLDTADVEKLLFEAEVGKLTERMYRLWNVRPRSEKEVRGYLRNLSFKRKVKGSDEISDKAIDLLVSKLKQKRLLSDEEFAKAWVEGRRRSKKKGKVALKQELFQKGIDKEIIEEVLSQTTDEMEQELAKQALEKKMKVWKNLLPLEFKKKAFEFLTRKGFEYDIVKEVIEKTTHLM